MTDIEDLLVKTSRTFALSIPRLPEPIRREVGIAYLLFRIADTLEDASHWEREVRIEELGNFVDVLKTGSADRARELAARWVKLGPAEHEGYVELMAETPGVLEELDGLGDEARAIVVRHTIRTAQGMSGFVGRTTDDRLELLDIQDLQDYCYVVAGIVGEMLTELFVLNRAELSGVSRHLEERARTFGEALQLVNILKDAADDDLEGRSYLPARVELADVFALARCNLETAGEYVRALQSASAPRGIVEFTALPVLLARATLDRVEASGAGAKLSRPEVASIVQGMMESLDEGRESVPA